MQMPWLSAMAAGFKHSGRLLTQKGTIKAGVATPTGDNMQAVKANIAFVYQPLLGTQAGQSWMGSYPLGHTCGPVLS